MKTEIYTEKSPAPVGPYSQAIKHGDTLYVSGQLPIDPETGKICEGSIQECARQSLENLKAVVEAAGATMDQIVKTTVLMANLEDFADANTVYAEYFNKPYPSRSAYQVAKLPLNVRIEIEAVVAL
ncbi:RidA family protein [Halodesulfovibrio sp. MK-HDV]|uniref:RidA family protein n=1 Tax=unclassified Halodesulfovibrio TaxID=2644657 RepID=UPI00136DCDBF|nr:RidA family protein [Halodesulfovibrio sp. MK-HDV]KAF1077044.1 2-iminobutanoate/2-iminopropanoate deaminase [Halodesulfovibrio sp. MK-HDV]